MKAWVLTLIFAAPAAAQDQLTHSAAFEAWNRIYAVVAHPRCTNCHVGADGVPMWNALGYGENIAHGMNVRADDSRIGAETMPCRTCHVTAELNNETPHAPPQIDDAWRLPPVELAWLGKSSAEVCNQLRNPAVNDDLELDELRSHLETSAFVAWGFSPGGARSTPPGSLDDMVDAMRIWARAGAPCVADR